MEIWKDIEGYNGEYQVSNHGRIKSLKFGKERIIKLGYNMSGYVTGKISKSGIAVSKGMHRWVAETFIPNPDNKPEVNHKDGNKLNNNDWNLEWVTRGENMRHAVTNGLHVAIKRGDHYLAKKVIDIKTGVVYNCVSDASKIAGIRHTYLANMLNGYFKNKTTMRYYNG